MGFIIKGPSGNIEIIPYHKMGRIDNKMAGEGAMNFVFLLLPEMVNTFICSLVGISSVCISNMIMIVGVHCSFLIWFSAMIFSLHLKVSLKKFHKMRRW